MLLISDVGAAVEVMKTTWALVQTMFKSLPDQAGSPAEMMLKTVQVCLRLLWHRCQETDCMQHFPLRRGSGCTRQNKSRDELVRLWLCENAEGISLLKYAVFPVLFGRLFSVYAVHLQIVCDGVVFKTSCRTQSFQVFPLCLSFQVHYPCTIFFCDTSKSWSQATGATNRHLCYKKHLISFMSIYVMY